MPSFGSCPKPAHLDEYVIKGEVVLGSLTTQHLLLFISFGAAGIATVGSLFLIMKHLHRYTEPMQQRQIIRMIFTPVVFSVLSAVSIINYDIAEYMQPLTALYETFGLASLFLLFVEYVASDKNTRNSYFDSLAHYEVSGSVCARPRKIVEVPGGCLQWFNSKWAAVFGYCIIDTVFTILVEITQATGHYCATSFSPRYFHIWDLIITNVFLGFAIEAIIYYYFRMKKLPEFAMHKPGLKLVSFKLIVSINFLQSIILNIISGTSLGHGTSSVTYLDIKYGIPATLIAIEQIGFALFFHYSFRSREYHETMKGELAAPRMGTFRAAAHAFTPIDLLAAMGQAIKLAPAALASKFGGKARSQASLYNKLSGSRQTHLEPMRYQANDLDSNEAYRTTYQGAAEMNNVPAIYQPPPMYNAQSDYEQTGGQYAGPYNENASLNPSGYHSAHSREPSVDGRARSTREMM